MIVQEFTLDKYKWQVTIYYDVSKEFLDVIIDELNELGCDEEDILSVIYSVESNEINGGSTHSNILKRKSILIIGLADSAAEFMNTLTHETGHLSSHISIADNISPFGEEIQYLSGDISLKMFKVTEKFLCSHCRAEIVG